MPTQAYVFLLILLRVSGKRQVGQLAPFDLVLVLVLSNSVQNAVNAGETSMTAGILSANPCCLELADQLGNVQVETTGGVD